jgi:hypothetical protein
MATDMAKETDLRRSDAASSAGATVREMASTAADAGRQLRERIPEVMSTSISALDEADRRLQGEPDEALRIGGTFSVGLGLGLFIAGAPRSMVLLAISPALAMGATLIGRKGGQSRLGL